MADPCLVLFWPAVVFSSSTFVFFFSKSSRSLRCGCSAGADRALVPSHPSESQDDCNRKILPFIFIWRNVTEEYLIMFNQSHAPPSNTNPNTLFTHCSPSERRSLPPRRKIKSNHLLGQDDASALTAGEKAKKPIQTNKQTNNKTWPIVNQ